MTDSPLRSDYPPPRDPAALDRWLRTREDALAEVLSREITRIVQRSVRAFEVTLPALTASGDMSVFDDIPVQWNDIVDERLLPQAEQVYLSGGVSVWAAAPEAIPAAAATAWAAMVNVAAADYISQRRNLMVGVGDNLFQGVMQQVERAITTGASTEEIKQSLERLGNFSEFRADVIARTEIQTAYANGNWQASVALGEYGPVEKEWLATNDARTRDTHRDIDGTVLPFGEAFTVGGAQMMFPKDPSGPASEVVQCRCVLLEYWPGDARRDGSIVPERGAPIENAVTEPTTESAVQKQARQTQANPVRDTVPERVNQARHDPQFFRTRFTRQWYSDTIGDSDFFAATDTNDAVLRSIIRDQGFNAKPAIVSPQRFDTLADEGWTVVHRGINAPSEADLSNYVTNFLEEDDFYVGRGMFGNGVNSSTIRETAEEYAKTQGLSISFRGETSTAVTGRVLDMAIHPEARILDLDDAYKLRTRMSDEARERSAKMMERWPTREVPHPYRDGETMIERVPYDELQTNPAFSTFADEAGEVINYENVINASEDIGKVAALNGYDAIRVVNPKMYNDQFQIVELPDTYYIILNRGAVAVRQS